MKRLLPLVSSLLLVACNSSGSKNVYVDVGFYEDLPYSEIAINSATFSGLGCPGDKDRYVISADKKVITLLLDSYIAEAGEGTGASNSRVTCNMAISLNIPKGYRAMLINADFRGAVTLPDAGSLAEFKREYFFANGSSPILTDRWDGALEAEDIQIFDRMSSYGGELSKCGEDVILRSNTSLYISVPDNAETSEIAIDSLDFKGSAQLDYRLNYVPCQ